MSEDQVLELTTEEEVVDEFQRSFEQLEESTIPLADKLDDLLLLLKNERLDDQAVKVKEQCVYRLAKLYSETKQFHSVLGLLKMCNELFSVIPKAKTAKIVRNILNIIAEAPDSLDIQVQLCREVVEWCKVEKRTFLRQRIEAKLASLLLKQKQPALALDIIDELLKELRKLDDKQMLTEAHLTEARIYLSLQNIPKSKASLTASRTAANSIYVTPLLQAEIDEMSGTLHCEETDYTTAYSYFLEAFDAYDQSMQKVQAVSCLKYMILCKVLSNNAHEVPSLLSSKLAIKHVGPDLDAMAAIAKAAKDHSLEEFQRTISKFGQLLRSDDLIAHNLDLLYDNMLEANLLKIIHPYSSVEIAHVAKLVKLDEQQVVQKLSQMILDHKFSGILEQGKGHLIVYESSKEDKSFTRALEIVGNLGQAVDVLFARAKKMGEVTL